MKCEAAFNFGISAPITGKQGAGAKGRGGPITPMGSGMMSKASANVGGMGMSYKDMENW
jgi:hypothetical protein